MVLKIKDIDETQAPLLDHLIELRARLMRIILALVVAFFVCFYFANDIFGFLVRPLTNAFPPGQGKLIYTQLYGAFFVSVKVALFAAFVVSFPIIANQLWAFVAPGLYPHEKKLVLPLVISSTVLFFIGVAFCYFFVFGQVFAFIQGFAPKSITAAPDIEAYLSFVLTMFIAFGLAFEVPIVVIVLARMGLVSVQKLKDFRGYFIVLAFIIAAIVTPPDVVSQLALALPMCLLYEVGIWAAQIFIKHTRAPDAEPVAP